jgi:hypothetical protein
MCNVLVQMQPAQLLHNLTAGYQQCMVAQRTAATERKMKKHARQQRNAQPSVTLLNAQV